MPDITAGGIGAGIYEKRGGGMAKPKYEKWLEPENLTLLEGWARDGLTDEQIAKNMGIATSTLYEYKKKVKGISEALKKNKEIADYEVENALYKKCIGYWVKEDRAFKCKEVFYDDEGRRCEKEELKTVQVDVYVQPDTTAQLAWLNNRRRDRWRRNAGKEVLDEKKFEHDKEIDGKKYW